MTYRPKVPKDLRASVRAAMDQGWTLTYTGKHLKITSPDGITQPIPGSSSAPELFKCIKSRLRKCGVDF